jgi:hypothetical protein
VTYAGKRAPVPDHRRSSLRKPTGDWRRRLPADPLFVGDHPCCRRPDDGFIRAA